MTRIDSDDWVVIIVIIGLVLLGLGTNIVCSISETKVKTACIEQGGEYKDGNCTIDKRYKQD